MKTIKIGKSPNNDHVINDASVSRQHAVVTILDDGRIVLRDLNSTNGTFVNGKRITTDTVVQPQDQVRLGTYNLSLSALLNVPQKTVIRAAGNPLRKTIGRASDQDIVIQGTDVSSKHAVLEKLPNGQVQLTDLGSTNGTFVNSQRITSVVLKKGDSVAIASHPFAWEAVFPAGGGKPQKSGNALPAIAAVVLVLLLVGAGLFYWTRLRPMPASKIYDKYKSAVCLVYGKYHYRLSFDGADPKATELCYQVLKISPDAKISLGSGANIVTGNSQTYQGTGFFISPDGKIGTNLHIAKPWLFSDESDKLEQVVRLQLENMIYELEKLDTRYGNKNAATFALMIRNAIPKINVQGEFDGLWVIPNGMHLSDENLHSCVIYKTQTDKDKDVAVLQTSNKALPVGVTAIVDINKAQTSQSATKQGSTIHVIGFPSGISFGVVKGAGESVVLENQIQSGTVTQNRGDVSFGHSASSTGGSSGSPVLDERGRLVGVLNAGFSQNGVSMQGFSMAIRAKWLLELLE